MDLLESYILAHLLACSLTHNITHSLTGTITPSLSNLPVDSHTHLGPNVQSIFPVANCPIHRIGPFATGKMFFLMYTMQNVIQ